MTQHNAAAHHDLDWLLDGMVRQVAGVGHAVLLSDDGLVMGSSTTLGRADAERLAAIATGQQSLARGIGEIFDGGPVQQVMVELADLWLFLTSAGRGTHLAVIASQEVDAELIAVAMHTLVRQVGQKLGTEARRPEAAGRPGRPE
ncbi:roadblock/LC7 domain-containing protein [Kitasatospora sp. YST-16]|uniref:roadblock/LC7 domain-containing protein n=1 Tax=Kitasatospora sp. YST-16 TaxID=2998080 RepID=UPI0022837F22|nr:roadblock/LC7 domain-containing protein [Kitasatospora sp. YST-16]WAL74658.1 roadblock/LC7 domain-containing protein [Kitasatospora sp. YST-16]WNW40716.1 roadblock/LC7 domain-containing protein [Streptomyces sp. Li-HN-5-13]